MLKARIGYCEVCGKPSSDLQEVSIEDSIVLVCPNCLVKLKQSAKPVVKVESKASVRRERPRVRRELLESFDIVDDYGERVRRAREARGWSEAVLAQKLRVSVDVVRRIEAGKYKPSLDLARRIESILKVKLLVPTEIEEFSGGKLEPLTLGDVVVVRRGEEKTG